MGKAKRAKLNRQNEEAKKQELEALKRADKKESVKIYVSVIAIMLAVAIVVGGICLVINNVRSSGNYLRNKIAVYSDNYEVNNAMLSYLFADNFYMQKSYFDYYQSYFKLDTTAPLKTQEYQDGMSWYDYFLTSAIQNAASMLISDEAAKAEGITLDDEDNMLIEKEIGLLKADAEELSMDFEDYLSKYYGLGVKEQDVRDALELYYISYKYYYHQMDGINITKDAIKAYYDANSSDYNRVSFKSYTVEALYPTGSNAGEINKAYLEAEKAANEIASAKDVEEFDVKLQTYLTDLHKRDGSANVSFNDILEEVEDTLYIGVAYAEGNDYMDWLFADERQVNDTTVIDEGNGKYTVYILTSPKAREEYMTQNVRHILFLSNDYETDEECKAAAEAVLAEFNRTDKSEEAFAKLAKKYSADTGSVYTGGLYENVVKGEMVEEFEDWIYDDTRNTGDVAIVKSDAYGYHIMFYVGEGLSAWEAAVLSTLETEEYNKISEEITQKYEVMADIKIADNIPDLNK